ncbi:MULTISPECIES: hypothetical protein [Pacificibacter]|uniref:hypothetical protein n=1 Tax=Pacificibacter TaxID=1042323 RepID=UPI001C089303|nr:MULTISPECIES: hypothetical protein [Pacificibacter]MBU2934783.1 hypothetical protein [Pacificibacter marinus]MDO6615757.1 hypothetical protein [Pacificibacter sp. 1_MG-2023]
MQPFALLRDDPIQLTDFHTAAINDLIRYIHLLAVVIGFGTAFAVDATFLRRLKAPITRPFIAALHWHHQLVSYALLVMWMSGLALVYLRTGFDLENFSPKLIAKIIVVSILTANAWMINIHAMPLLAQSVGNSPLSLPSYSLIHLSLVAGVSTASWLLGLALGSSVILKTADATVFMCLLPIGYLCSGLMAIVTLLLVQSVRNRHEARAQ